jgi:D-alanyl-D-alanine carboxypeptidase
VVYTGPTRTGAALVAAVAADADSQTVRRGKKSRVAARASSEPKAGEAKPEAKPAKHASAKPEAATKPAAAADQSAKPAKPKAAAKPKGDGKPAPKGTSADGKPAG